MFSVNGAGQTGQHNHRIRVDPYISACTKNNPKWMKDSSIRPELKQPKGKIGETPYSVGVCEDSLKRTPRA